MELKQKVQATTQELKAAQDAVVAQNLKELKAAQEAVWESKDAAHEALVRAVQAKAAWEAADEEAVKAIEAAELACAGVNISGEISDEE